MNKFFKMRNGAYINIDAIQYVEPIKASMLYKDESELWMGMLNFLKEIGYTDKQMEQFGIFYVKSSSTCNGFYTYHRDEIRAKNMTVGYKIHLGAPCGGINNSHVAIPMSSEEFEKLSKILDNFK